MKTAPGDISGAVSTSSGDRIRTRDLWVMSYALGIFTCPPSLKSAGQRPSGVWPVAPHRTDSRRFHRVLFPNLFPNESACRPLSGQAILDVGLPSTPHCQEQADS